MNIRLATYLQEDSIVDGEGIRAVVWTQGCSHNCKGCHNPTTHDFDKGFLLDTEEVKKEIDLLEGQNGITFSGGDPMFQSEACTDIAKYAKSKGLNIWCYTGFTYEQLINNPAQKEFLKYIDILVDGKFEIEQFSLNLQYKGSKNQRIIDVKRSLEEEKVVLVEEYLEEKNYQNLYKKPEYLFI